jgi:glycosyltransferase involved in cell wall biosynthesis
MVTLEQSFAPDVVHLNGFAHGRWPFAAPKLVVGHSCVCSWFEAVKREPAPSPQWDRYRSEVRAGLRAADKVVAPSAAMLAALERHYGPLPHGSVVHNGRDASRYRGAAEKEDFVLTAGRLWDEAKNVAALNRVAVELPCAVCVAGDDRHPDAAAGDGRMAADHLVMLGRLDEPAMADWLARAAVYALPARYEPFGLSVLEAALSGCALVLSDIPSLRELWDGAAAFVDPDDAAAFSAALRRAVEDKPEQRRLAALARGRAARYSAVAMGGHTRSCTKSSSRRATVQKVERAPPSPPGEGGVRATPHGSDNQRVAGRAHPVSPSPQPSPGGRGGKGRQTTTRR